MQVKRFTITVTAQRFVKRVDLIARIPLVEVYGAMYQRYGFNKQGKPIMLKIEITKIEDYKPSIKQTETA